MSFGVRVVGLEPTSAYQGAGFEDRCVYQFHHTRVLKTGAREPCGSLCLVAL